MLNDPIGLAMVALMGLGLFLGLVIVLVVIKKQGGTNGGISGGQLIGEVESALSGAGAALKHAPTHGEKIGKAIDATDALGTLLTSGGFMSPADWQPIGDKITAAVASYKPVPAAPATTGEAPKA